MGCIGRITVVVNFLARNRSILYEKMRFTDCKVGVKIVLYGRVSKCMLERHFRRKENEGIGN